MIDHDDIRRLVSSADPASVLPPLRSDERHRLMENAMTDSTAPTATRPLRHNRRRALILGTVVGLSIAGAAALTVPLVIPSHDVEVAALSQPTSNGPAAMCAEVTVDAIAAADDAFLATVTNITGETVTLTVTDHFIGDVGDTVEVPQGTSTGIDGEALTFTAGESYLISTAGDTIRTCGLSGPDSPELKELFTAAKNQ